MDARFEDQAATPIAAGPEDGRSRRQMLWWRLASILLFCIAWEIAGRVPISLAFPTFSATVAAFVEMVADGSMLNAYVLTLEPLLIALMPNRSSSAPLCTWLSMARTQASTGPLPSLSARYS